MGSVVIVFQSRCLTHSSLARNPIMATASADPGFRLTGMTKGLQWNVVVLFPRIFQRLVAQLPQSQSDAPPSGVRRSEERRVGKECVSSGRLWGWRDI